MAMRFNPQSVDELQEIETMTIQAQRGDCPEARRSNRTSRHGFAISEWHDTDEVMARLQALLDQPAHSSDYAPKTWKRC